MTLPSRSKIMLFALAGLALTGCTSAVQTQPTLTVIPGQGKTEANLRADDASCRANPTGSSTAPATRTQTDATAPAGAAPITAEQYYACMAAHGEAVIEQRTEVYPAYAGYPGPYAYPAYPYGYPYAGYPYGFGYGYGYPFYGPYFGPYVGFGFGFGYGRFYGGRVFHGGYHGFGGYHGGYGRGYAGGFHGGGGRR